MFGVFNDHRYAYRSDRRGKRERLGDMASGGNGIALNHLKIGEKVWLEGSIEDSYNVSGFKIVILDSGFAYRNRRTR